MNTFKVQCISLRKLDFTLTEIVKKTGRSKTSVYFHIKDIPLSKGKQEQIKRNSGDRGRKVALLRKGKSERPFHTFTVWTPELVSLVAHLIFDGGICKSCVYSNRSRSLLNVVERNMRILYDYVPKRYTNKTTGVHRISYHNVALASFLKEKERELINGVLEFPLEHQRAFLCAFFDDEGCMDYRKERNLRRVRGYQNDRHILSVVQSSLKRFRISADLKGKNEVVISGRENLSTFQREINFSKGVRINGDRPNSIWKRSIEKRTLLDQAIGSYKQ
jgi:hypothetical protein